GGIELLDHVGVIGGNEVLQHLRGAGGAHVASAEDVLVRQRDAGQRTLFAFGANVVGGLGLRQRQFLADSHIGVDGAIESVDAVEVIAGEFQAGKFTAVQRAGEFSDCSA